jgi:hypothetical protein
VYFCEKLEENNLILLDNLGDNIKGRLWIDELSEAYTDYIGILEKSFIVSSELGWEYRRIALELAQRRHSSNYALLEVSFEPGISKELILKVVVSADLGEPMHDAQTMLYDEVRWGIPQQYSEAIINTAAQYINEFGGFPAGVLSFSLGAHAKIGSSNMIFSKVTQLLLKLISYECKDLADEELKAIIHTDIKSGS